MLVQTRIKKKNVYWDVIKRITDEALLPRRMRTA